MRCHEHERHGAAAIAAVASAMAALFSHARSTSSSSITEEGRTVSRDNNNTYHLRELQHSWRHGLATLSSGRFNTSPWFSSVAKCEATVENKMNTFPRDAPTNNGGSVADHYYIKMEPNELERTLLDSHAVFGALWGKELIERYNVYRRVSLESTQQQQKNLSSHKRELIVVDVKLGNRLNGHGGVAHGGIISLLIDEAMGWAYESLQEEYKKKDLAYSHAAAVTANLTVDFRAPLMEGSDAIIRVYHNETNGRKIYFSATLESNDGNVVFAEAKSLFIRVRPDQLKSKL